jgi:hypothetical protein
MKDRTFAACGAIRDAATATITVLLTLTGTVSPLILGGTRFSNGKFQAFETRTTVVDAGTRPLEESVYWGCWWFAVVVYGLCGDICAVYECLSLRG